MTCVFRIINTADDEHIIRAQKAARFFKLHGFEQEDFDDLVMNVVSIISTEIENEEDILKERSAAQNICEDSMESQLTFIAIWEEDEETFRSKLEKTFHVKMNDVF